MRKAVDVRPSWNELSIRERNIILYRAVVEILGIDEGRSWTDVRLDLTDEKIREIYSVFGALWPLETDLLQLLPKPDGIARAVYTGMIDPPMVTEFVVGASLYFSEIIVQNPFLHPLAVRDEFSPVKNPKSHRQEFLKSVFALINLMPLVDEGTINLIPDPCYFDRHLQQQMFSLAGERANRMAGDIDRDARSEWAMKGDFWRSLLALPPDVQRSQIKRAMPDLAAGDIEETLRYMQQIKEDDPLVVLQENTFTGSKEGGLVNSIKMSPNFEVSMFLAQATGSFIITDSRYRWKELLQARNRKLGIVLPRLVELTNEIERSAHHFVLNAAKVHEMKQTGQLASYRSLIQDVYTYLLEADRRGTRKRLEAQIASRFSSIHVVSQREIQNASTPMIRGELRCIIPEGGITHTNASRMLLTAGVEHRLESVPMAFLIERPDASLYKQMP